MNNPGNLPDETLSPEVYGLETSGLLQKIRLVEMCLPPQEDIWAAFSLEVIQEKLFLALRARVEKNNFAKQMSLPWRRECKSIFGGAQCLIKKCCI